MATDITSIFGSEIMVAAQNSQADRQFSGFAGAHGMTSMLLGSRGYPIVVKGIIRGTGSSYQDARNSADDTFQTVEDLLFAAADEYSFQGRTYADVVWSKIEKIPDSRGSVYHYTSAGDIIVSFIATGRALF